MKWIGFMMMLCITPAWSQSFTDKITRELAFEKKSAANAVMIFNINGDVKVEGYSGDKILVEVTRKISGKTSDRMEKGKAVIQLGVIDRADTIMLYVVGGCQEFGRMKRKHDWRHRTNGWGYRWDGNDGYREHCEEFFDYQTDFVVKVPLTVNVMASTVNDGDVELSNVSGRVDAENINGSVRLKSISGGTWASTINGDVDLDYVGNPSSDSRYYSLNGDINANFVKGLAAQLTFKSFNGEFYSSVDDITPMAVELQKYENGEGIRYKVNGNRYRVRKGGPLLDFETFNGDVYLREK